MDKPHTSVSGTVYLVGAGPGDPGLITVKGMQLLESADVVVHDRLVDKRLLVRAPREIEIIDVRELPGKGSARQVKINALLIDRAKKGKNVVRLKGGDPLVFGRGGEEGLALVEAGIPFEIVPGVTSAIAGPAYAGIPLTHRGYASSLTIVTGTESSGKVDASVAWDKLAQAGGTLVILMGWENLASITDTLIREGLPPDTLVAAVQWGTEPYQRTVVGSVSNIYKRARKAGLAPPVAVVIGKVVELRERLCWFDNRPIFGKRILVTRTRDQAGALSSLVRAEGAWPIELPTIEIEALDDYSELDDALGRLGSYDWVIFTSVNAVRAVFERLTDLGGDARAFSTARVAVIGSATAASLRERGIEADNVAKEFVSESVLEGFKRQGVAGLKILLPRPETAPERLSRGLQALGASVQSVPVYRTVTPKDAAARVLDILSEGVDVATFTSSSTVKNLASLLDGKTELLGKAKIACIGPVTAATVREVGLKVDILAEEHTVKGLVKAMKAYFSREVFSNE